MSDKYIVFNNGSKAARDIESFFEENKIPYATVLKVKDSRALVFPLNHAPAYNERNFGELKESLLNKIN